VLPLHSANRSLDFLVELIGTIRPENAKDIPQATLRFKALLYQMTQDRSSLFSLRKVLLTQFLKTNIVNALTESGITSSRGFVQELTGKVLHKFLPELQTPDNFLYVINRIFYKKKDHIWVEGIELDLWIQFFEVLGIPVYYADDAAKKLMNNDQNLQKQIIQHFGKESFINGRLNRAFLADIVFSNPAKTKLINSIIHPATIADAEKWMQKQNAPYAIKEAALIFEANAEKNLDLIIGVSSTYELRLQRVMLRDGINKEAVEKRMQNQMDENKKMESCDFVLNNNETELLIPQVLELHKKILQNIERVHV
jgi:dephospho-CoA kinase